MERKKRQEVMAHEMKSSEFSSGLTSDISEDFIKIVNEITHIGFKQHCCDLLKNAQANAPFIFKSLNDLSKASGEKAKSGIVVSAGPSLRRQHSLKKIKESNYKGTIIAVDGTYIACLKEGIIPDYIMTLDPHPTRMVRWFGDHDFEENSRNDDYFQRQDLDIEFRKNTIEQNKVNIDIVNKHAHLTKSLVCTSIPQNVVSRMLETKSEMYWWNPLVDNPNEMDSLTRKLYELNQLPCMNTGGTVGTAAWVFASTRLRLPEIALLGMDFGYYSDTPIHKTQTYFELVHRLGTDENIENYFSWNDFPLTDEKFYTDPTYFWYKRNFLDLYRQVSDIKTYNCSEGGTLVEDDIKCIAFEGFLNKNS